MELEGAREGDRGEKTGKKEKRGRGEKERKREKGERGGKNRKEEKKGKKRRERRVRALFMYSQHGKGPRSSKIINVR